jgi:hypothetical protein
VIKVASDLALLCDITHHLNDINAKFQGQQKVISDICGVVRAFEMKLNYFGNSSKMLTSAISLHVIFPEGWIGRCFLSKFQCCRND